MQTSAQLKCVWARNVFGKSDMGQNYPCSSYNSLVLTFSEATFSGEIGCITRPREVALLWLYGGPCITTHGGLMSVASSI